METTECLEYKKGNTLSKLTNQQSHDLCVAFRKLSIPEFKIFEYLYANGYYSGDISSLARAIGYKDAIIPNVRKALLSLNRELKIVCICKNFYNDSENLTRYGGYEGFFLIDGWQENLLKYSKERKMPGLNIHRKERSKKRGASKKKCEV